MGLETLIPAGASLIGGIMGSDAAEDAAATQAASADRATQLQKEMFERQIELQEPFRQGGLAAQNRLLTLLGLQGGQDAGSLARDFSMDDFQADPGYQFRLQQGQRALERSAAARGGLLSGSALKAATEFGQGMGAQEFQNAYNRFQTNRANKLNPLQSLMGAAQTAAGTQGQAAQQFGSNVGNLMTGTGNALAASRIAQGSSWSNALGGAANAFQQNQLMNRMFPTSGYSGYTGYTGGADPLGDFITSRGF